MRVVFLCTLFVTTIVQVMAYYTSFFITHVSFFSSINLSRKLKHSLINTCWSILLLKLAFMLGIKMRIEVGCQILGIAIHYFSITSLLWMTVIAWSV